MPIHTHGAPKNMYVYSSQRKGAIYVIVTSHHRTSDPKTTWLAALHIFTAYNTELQLLPLLRGKARMGDVEGTILRTETACKCEADTAARPFSSTPDFIPWLLAEENEREN